MAAEESPQPANLAQTLLEVSERASLLVREEIELAKAEVTEKVGKLLRGAVVAIVAGIFVVTGLMFALHGLAWLVWFELFGPQNNIFWGYFFVAALMLVVAGLAGFFAWRAVRGGPPTPAMAIEEARKFREAVGSGEGER